MSILGVNHFRIDGLSIGGGSTRRNSRFDVALAIFLSPNRQRVLRQEPIEHESIEATEIVTGLGQIEPPSGFDFDLARLQSLFGFDRLQETDKVEVGAAENPIMPLAEGDHRPELTPKPSLLEHLPNGGLMQILVRFRIATGKFPYFDQCSLFANQQHLPGLRIVNQATYIWVIFPLNSFE